MTTEGRKPAQPTPEELETRLRKLRSARGFLLPHHGAMAAAMPDLHEAYLRMYQALTVEPRHLSALEKESIWLAILVATREGVGTHHLELLLDAGADLACARSLISMAGHAPVFDSLSFAEKHWSAFLPDLDPAGSYSDGLNRLRAGTLPESTAELAMLTVQAANHCEGGVAHHLRRAYAIGIPEEQMAEALGFLIWPCGVNVFLDACTVWHGLMVSGDVSPSPLFRVWAQMGDLGAYRRDGTGGPGDFDVGDS